MKIRGGSGLLGGTTLVEVVTAVAILAVAAGGLVGAFGYGFFTSQVVRENQRATQILVEKLETVRLYSWDQITSNNFVPVSFTAAFDPAAPTNKQGCTYYGRQTLSAVPWNNSISTNMRQYTLTINWTNQGKLPHTRSISTYLAKDGVQNYVY